MRDSVLRLLALWAVLSGTSPLPMLLANSHAHAAPRMFDGGGGGGDEREGWSDYDGFGAWGGVALPPLGAPAPDSGPASWGTIDELVELWPALARSEGLVFDIDLDDFVLGGFPMEVWGVFDGEPVLVGDGAYMPLHHSDTRLVPAPSDDPEQLGDRRVGAVAICLKYTGPAMKKCLFIVAAGYALLALACWAQAEWANRGCIAKNLHDNALDLTAVGCATAPPGGNP